MEVHVGRRGVGTLFNDDEISKPTLRGFYQDRAAKALEPEVLPFADGRHDACAALGLKAFELAGFKVELICWPRTASGTLSGIAVLARRQDPLVLAVEVLRPTPGWLHSRRRPRVVRDLDCRDASGRGGRHADIAARRHIGVAQRRDRPVRVFDLTVEGGRQAVFMDAAWLDGVGVAALLYCEDGAGLTGFLAFH